jgi:hypothetical protein
MGFGVKEPKTTTGEHVPGTALIYGNDADAENVELTNRDILKRGTGANSKVILVPQPSNSPNDPLVS